ncbi:hypothetical protein VHEMI07716 [[Torrubiella] hemipterigena]|uniref:Uncharacterized protein n=1 Tax=[Torrubiella] hemipterigena TaxID=1531966 RepID=A0A0A1TNF5_9HYPO|nr:hypothetical protein VHEMI07716 [[Torrubiella] hemipterigena]
MPQPGAALERDPYEDLANYVIPPLRTETPTFDPLLHDAFREQIAETDRRRRANHSRISGMRLPGPTPGFAPSPIPTQGADISRQDTTQTSLSYTSNIDHLGRLDRSLDEANSHLRALLDMTAHSALASASAFASFDSSLSSSRSRNIQDDHQRQGKRRKVDSKNDSGPSSISNQRRYSHYGQVDPCNLDLEIASCDGGMFSNEMSYVADNILRDDNTVYCTKGNRCNIVLRHRDSTIFTLTELTIKAPASMNYSHPVREGMVFLSMEDDDIFTRTARFQIPHSPPPVLPLPHSVRAVHTPRPEWSISVRHHTDGSTTTRARTSLGRSGSNERDFAMPNLPSEFTDNVPDLNVTTESSGHQEPNPYYVSMASFNNVAAASRRWNSGDQPPHIGSLPFEQSSRWSAQHHPIWSDSEEEGDDEDDHHATGANALPLPYSQHAASPTTRAAILSTIAHATAAGAPPANPPLMVPHAKFFIQHYKSQCKITFDPPISSRFILLKMWSSRHEEEGSNVDIQSVIAKGFVGPRYFPSTELA